MTSQFIEKRKSYIPKMNLKYLKWRRSCIKCTFKGRIFLGFRFENYCLETFLKEFAAWYWKII